jgi:uncharacterized repeat protein (TIGR03806 family)
MKVLDRFAGRVAAWVSLAIVAAIVGCGGGSDGGGDQPYALEQRVEVTGLNFPVSATGTTMTAVRAFPNLAFGTPTFMTHAGDGSNRLFVTQRQGDIRVFSNRDDVSSTTSFLDLTSKVDSSQGESGLLGMAFDPSYSSNGYFYVSYVPNGATRKLRVSRFQVSGGNADVANAASERVVYEFDHPGANHYGGWLAFGPDSMLYLSTGDGEEDRASQDLNRPLGKLLRMRVNADGSYTAPSDNPYGNLVWAYGFRNPWRCSFDRANGQLWCGDVGQSDREEINFVIRGGNYGWSFFEGTIPYIDAGSVPYSDFLPAIHQYDHTVGVAVIGGYVYRGRANPSLVGRYIYADAGTSNMWAINSDGAGNLTGHALLASNANAIQTFGEDEAGEVYGLSAFGQVYRLAPSGTSGNTAAMPSVLSATGIFSDLSSLQVKPGVIDYELNAPFWSDSAQKRRWVALPGQQTIGFHPSEPWSFPVGTVTVKHFDLPQPGGGTRRLETRVMVLRESGWEGATYRWRDDQSDADLVTLGATGSYTTVDPATGSATTVNWVFPSPAQCLACHTQASGRVLGLKTLQMNRSHSYAATGTADNQLRTLNHIGIFGVDIGDTATFAAMPDPGNSSAPVSDRARAYLDTNCSQCHRPNGPTPVNMDLRYTTAQDSMAIIGTPAAIPTVGGAFRVAPGAHANSDLWRRITAVDGNRMPPIGSGLVDQAGSALISEWIDSLR